MKSTNTFLENLYGLLNKAVCIFIIWVYTVNPQILGEYFFYYKKAKLERVEYNLLMSFKILPFLL